MKTISAFFILNLATYSFAGCPNLSHIYQMGAAEVHVKQVECSKWERQQFYQGKPIGEPSVLQFSPSWSIHEIDDEYEKGTLKHRWFWSEDSKAVIHDYVFDMIDKKSGTTSLGLLTETFSDKGSEILRKGSQVTRRQTKSGEISIESKPQEYHCKKLAE